MSKAATLKAKCILGHKFDMTGEQIEAARELGCATCPKCGSVATVQEVQIKRQARRAGGGEVMSIATKTSSPIEQLIACLEADPPFDIYERRSVIAAARTWVADAIEVDSEAAVEIENLTDKDNPVAVILRAKILEMEGGA